MHPPSSSSQSAFDWRDDWSRNQSIRHGALKEKEEEEEEEEEKEAAASGYF